MIRARVTKDWRLEPSDNTRLENVLLSNSLEDSVVQQDNLTNEWEKEERILG